MKHPALLISIAIAASCAYCAGYSLSFGGIALIMATGVAIVGLPHGGMDHRIGISTVAHLAPTARRQNKPAMLAVFMGLYLLLAAVVIAGWYIPPLFTISSFFVLAAWHFGLEEESTVGRLSWIDQLGVIARGGMVIWCTALFRPAEVTSLLQTILPGNSAASSQIVLGLSVLSPVFAGLLAHDLIRCLGKLSRRDGFLSVLRIGSFALMFAICPVLLSFTIYFCGWHSIRGLINLRHSNEGSTKQLMRQLVPMSLLAILLFFGGFVFFRSELGAADATVRTIFIGLSAVAVPHLLLHVVDDFLVSPQRAENHHGGNHVAAEVAAW